MSKYPYVDKYLENKKHVTLTNLVCEQLDLIKKQIGLNSNNDAVQYLIEIEQDARKDGILVKYGACEKCGTPINLELDSYKGITHQHVDSKSNCFGCIKTRYRVKTKIEVPSGSTIGTASQGGLKDQKVQVEQKDQQVQVKQNWIPMD
jgi:uncharacterized protein YwlG (UPF0340 family)